MADIYSIYLHILRPLCKAAATQLCYPLCQWHFNLLPLGLHLANAPAGMVGFFRMLPMAVECSNTPWNVKARQNVSNGNSSPSNGKVAFQRSFFAVTGLSSPGVYGELTKHLVLPGNEIIDHTIAD